MTHIQLPDTWAVDPAIVELSDGAQAGFIRLLSWSASQRTDGLLPNAALVAARVSRRVVAELVAAGLLVVVETGWQVVHPDQYLFTEEKRQTKSAAGSLGNKARWSHRIQTAPAIASRSQADRSAIADATEVRSHNDRHSQSQSQSQGESLAPTVKPARDQPRRPSVEGFTKAGDVDLRGPLLDERQLAAWTTFSEPRWAPVKEAWLARGLRYPPSGDQDEEGSQRQIMWQIVRDWPAHVPVWITQAPAGASPGDVVRYVTSRYHQAREESLEEAEGREAAWETEKAEERRAAHRIDVAALVRDVPGSRS